MSQIVESVDHASEPQRVARRNGKLLRLRTLVRAREAVKLAERVSHPLSLLLAAKNMSEILLWRREPQEAPEVGDLRFQPRKHVWRQSLERLDGDLDARPQVRGAPLPPLRLAFDLD